MATRKKAEDFGTFGWVSIRTNSSSALSNEYAHENELRKELQGKQISTQTIVDAMRKVGFERYGSQTCGVHSFFPDVGKCYVGKNHGANASVVLEWSVENQKQDELLKEVRELKDLVAKLLKEKA